MTGRIIRLPELMERTGLSRSTIYNRMDEGSDHYDPTFPKQVSLGSSAVGWREDEVDEWIRNRSSNVPMDIGAEQIDAPPRVRKTTQRPAKRTAATSPRPPKNDAPASNSFSVGRHDPTALLGQLVSTLEQTEYLKGCLRRETWTPVMGALLVSGIKAPVGCTEIPPGGESIDGRQLHASNMQFRQAQSILRRWLEQDDDDGDDEIRSSAESLPSEIRVIDFFEWCDDEQIDTDWLRLLREIAGCPIPGSVRHIAMATALTLSPPSHVPNAQIEDDPDNPTPT